MLELTGASARPSVQSPLPSMFSKWEFVYEIDAANKDMAISPMTVAHSRSTTCVLCLGLGRDGVPPISGESMRIVLAVEENLPRE